MGKKQRVLALLLVCMLLGSLCPSALSAQAVEAVAWPGNTGAPVALELGWTNQGMQIIRLQWPEADGQPVRYAVYQDGTLIGKVLGHVRQLDVTGLEPMAGVTFQVQAELSDGSYTTDGPVLQHAVPMHPFTEVEEASSDLKAVAYGVALTQWIGEDGAVNWAGLATDIADMQDLGIRWIRTGLRPGDNFEMWDQLLEMLQDAGIQAVFYYFKGEPSNDLGTPEQEAANIAVLKQLVARYGHYVKHWEIHNEPNLNAYWDVRGRVGEGTDDPGAPFNIAVHNFAVWLQMANAAIKEVDPTAKTILGGLSSWANVAFLDRLAAEGAYEHFDYIGWHPYTDNNAQSGPNAVIGRMNKLAGAIAAWPEPHRSKGIWLTEWGFHGSDHWNMSGPSRSEIAKANYLVESVHKLRDWGISSPMFWYVLHYASPYQGRALTMKHVGEDGSIATTRLPAYYAMKNMWPYLYYGDANLDGVVEGADVQLIEQAAAGTVVLTPNQLLAADYNRDGVVDAADAAQLEQDLPQFLAAPLPAGTVIVHDTFQDGNGLDGWTFDLPASTEAVVGASGLNAADLSLILRDNNDSNRVAAVRSFDPATGLVSLQWRYREAHVGSWTTFVVLSDNNPVIRLQTKTYLYLMGQDADDELTKVYPDTWYTLRLDIDTDDQRFDLYLDGVLMRENQPWLAKGYLIDGFRVTTGNSPLNTVMVDDLALTHVRDAQYPPGERIPEPDGTVIHHQSFDQETTGEPPVGWTIANGSEQVRTVVAEVPNALNKSMHLQDGDASRKTAAVHEFATDDWDIVTYQWTFREGNTNRWTRYFVQDASSGAAAAELVTHSGKLHVRGSDGSLLPAADLAANAWFTVRLVFDTHARTYDVYVDDMEIPAVSSTPYAASAAQRIDRLRFESATNTNSTYIDEVWVTVQSFDLPETALRMEAASSVAQDP